MASDNGSITTALAMYQAAVNELNVENARAMTFFNRHAQDAITQLQGTQSEGISYGYITDDARDFKAAINDLMRDMMRNFDALKEMIEGSTKAVDEKVSSADMKFMRMDKVDYSTTAGAAGTK